MKVHLYIESNLTFLIYLTVQKQKSIYFIFLTQPIGRKRVTT